MPDPESDAVPSLVSEQETHRSGPPREKCQRDPRGTDNEEDIPRGTLARRIGQTPPCFLRQGTLSSATAIL